MTTTNTYYTYDRSHRMKSQYILGGEAHYYTYNERNMVASIQDVGGPADFMRYFVYNGVGERVIVTDSTTHPGLPAYWTYDGRKLLQDKQLTASTPAISNYRHNSSSQDRIFGSWIEAGLSDASAPAFPASDGAGNITSLQDTIDGSDSFVANFNTEQIAATDNFKTRIRALSSTGAIRGQTTQEVYYARRGRVQIPSKGIELGGDRMYPFQSVYDPRILLLWILAHQGGVVLAQQPPGGDSVGPVGTGTHAGSGTDTGADGKSDASGSSGSCGQESGCCGPDITDWFADDLRMWLNFTRDLVSAFNNVSKARGAIIWGVLEPSQAIAAIGRQQLYRQFTFQGKCTPNTAECMQTATLCGSCVSTGDLGNFVLGATSAAAGLFRLTARLGIEWATRTDPDVKHSPTGNGLDSLEAGYDFAEDDFVNARPDAPPFTAANLCASLAIRKPFKFHTPDITSFIDQEHCPPCTTATVPKTSPHFGFPDLSEYSDSSLGDPGSPMPDLPKPVITLPPLPISSTPK